MIIQKDALVTIHVAMYDLQGNLIEETDPAGVTYLHGHADIFPRIEAALEGKKKGDTVEVTLEPEDSFGEFDTEAIYMVPVERLGDPALPRLLRRPGAGCEGRQSPLGGLDPALRCEGARRRKGRGRGNRQRRGRRPRLPWLCRQDHRRRNGQVGEGKVKERATRGQRDVSSVRSFRPPAAGAA